MPLELKPMMQCVFQGVVVTGVLCALAGCVQSRYEPIVYTDSAPAERWAFTPIEVKYKDTQSPAWNFEAVLQARAWECSQQADMGYILYRQLREYGSNKRPDENAQALADCQRYAYQQGDEAIVRLKQAKVSAKILDLSKDLYAKWSAFLAGMSISAPKDHIAAGQYETSRHALMIEERFAQ
ncbi:hypothetical protein SJI00_05935 [Pseudomonas sp. RP23018S]|uniref:hypothetical protein n=1 Tax=Pseudomonas sp. RP23018S TaxID=3096037 RepID=UPI002ACA700E|nr:hypothetical protein [Pseudomonas sp. RP23018S]MDZ5602305.1 hypothetical protein [Pseudomonas sp. RP23018S]